MFCPNCGKSINEEMKFCGYCGHSRTGEVSVFRQEQERTESLQNPTRTIQKSGGKRNFSRVLSLLLTGVLIVTAIFVTPLAKNYILDITLEQRVKRAEKNIIWLEKDYEWIGPFFDGFAAVMKKDKDGNNKYGYIDKNGREIVELKYDLIIWNEYLVRNFLVMVQTGLKKNLFPVIVGRTDANGDIKWGYIDKSGKEVVELQYDYAWDFSEGFAPVEKKDISGNEKCGYIDKTGKEVVELKYDDAWDFSEGMARVMKKDISGNEKWGYIDKSGNEKWGYIDKNGEEVVELKYDDTDGFYEGFAPVMKKERKWWNVSMMI